MQFDQLIQTIALAAIPILFAITLHEAAHGYVARHFGDMTAYQQGRISLNPLRHIDPVGTILLPILTLWLGGILFERTGSYNVVWWLSVLFGILSAIINLPIIEKPIERLAPIPV